MHFIAAAFDAVALGRGGQQCCRCCASAASGARRLVLVQFECHRHDVSPLSALVPPKVADIRVGAMVRLKGFKAAYLDSWSTDAPHQVGNEDCMGIRRARMAVSSAFAHDADLAVPRDRPAQQAAGPVGGEKLGLTEAESEAYAKAVVQADFEETGDEDVIRKLIGDLLKGGVETSDIEVREMLSRMAEEARAQIEAQTEKG
jgi:hypothetical protein